MQSIKYQLSNHCFVFSSSPQSPEKKREALEFWKVSIQCLIDSSNTTVLEFYTFHHYYYYTFYLMISMNVGQFDRKVKYYLVLYVENIRRIHYLSLGHD